MGVSGWFAFHLFLSHCNKIWNNRLQALKQRTSYSSVYLKKTDILLDRHSQDMGAKRLQRSHCCANHSCFFYASRLLLLVVPCTK